MIFVTYTIRISQINFSSPSILVEIFLLTSKLTTHRHRYFLLHVTKITELNLLPVQNLYKITPQNPGESHLSHGVRIITFDPVLSG